MNDKQFETVDSELLEQSNKTLLNRKGAYAQNNDRLANFKETGKMVGLTPEKVCEVYLYKSLTAMLKILHGAPAIGESQLERFGDVLNYVRLAHALVREKQFAAEAPKQDASKAAQSIQDCMGARQPWQHQKSPGLVYMGSEGVRFVD